MMKPATKMMSYQNSDEDDDDAAALLLVPTLLAASTTMTTTTMTTTMDRRSLQWMSLVAGMLLLLLVVAGGGGTVLLRNGETTAEGLVVAAQTPKHHSSDCVAASMDATFGGISVTTTLGIGKSDPFKTCYQYGDETKYCWSNSYYSKTITSAGIHTLWFECHPKPKHGQWDSLDPKYVNTPGVDPKTNPKLCGSPCEEMYHGASF